MRTGEAGTPTGEARNRERLRLVIGGHVDHGKSTVIGRLLADTGSLPAGRLDQVRARCERTGIPFEYAFLLDALRDEQRQGITIEAARIFFETATRSYLLFDAPGHVEFLRNMVTGTAQADAAFLVLDAHEGLRENSFRHGVLMSLLGVRHLAVLVNKMDLVEFERTVFETLSGEIQRFLGTLGVEVVRVIPVSGREGSNVVHRDPRMAWYDGPTVVEQLDRFPAEAGAEAKPFRMPVQDVYRFPRGGDRRRIVAGTIESGTLRPGDEVVFHPSGKRSRVLTLEAFPPEDRHVARAGEAAGFTLAEQVYVPRGEVVARAAELSPLVTTRFGARIFWLGQAPLEFGKEYVLRVGTSRGTARMERVVRVVNASTLVVDDGKSLVERHEVADVILVSDRPLAWDPPEVCLAMSRFVIVEDHRIVGGGVIRAVAQEERQNAPEGNSLVGRNA